MKITASREKIINPRPSAKPRVLEYELAAFRLKVALRQYFSARTKANFNPNQPRIPKENPGGGRWTSEGGVEVTTSDGFLTGIDTIDNISQALSDTLLTVIEALGALPGLSPSQFGTAVHLAFGNAVRLQNLPGVGDIERTFSLEDSDPRYGLAGSIRTDVVLRDDRGEIIAIYDVKTGDEPLSFSRAEELRTKTRAAPNTPVFELNIVRGLSRKAAWGAKWPWTSSLARTRRD
jgi:hypothetical protein